ncbi:MAG: hypothetical protein B7733_06770 [Myxococcales bacterium FL481]|nr:MAG: hypothetical protein B7733_06770 [Myxococcales bacterium FL481]
MTEETVVTLAGHGVATHQLLEMFAQSVGGIERLVVLCGCGVALGYARRPGLRVFAGAALCAFAGSWLPVGAVSAALFLVSAASIGTSAAFAGRLARRAGRGARASRTAMAR